LHGKGMKRDIINSTVESIPGIKHTAIYPVHIIKELIKLLCPKGGVVLDPYVGSGTTAIAAIEEGRHFIGIEIDPSYCNLATKRIEECQIMKE
ncbi:MAG: site-specific DNA-methyltransferase, partial [Rhodobacteraceae bacterium]|nr:site-specific DNA-methyltransferase [Paracoccaceae bacterium]